MHNEKRKCISCSHCECIDEVRGVGVCAPMEGETVLLGGDCICPKDTLKLVDALIDERAERRKSGDYTLG